MVGVRWNFYWKLSNINQPKESVTDLTNLRCISRHKHASVMTYIESYAGETCKVRGTGSRNCQNVRIWNLAKGVFISSCIGTFVLIDIVSQWNSHLSPFQLNKYQLDELMRVFGSNILFSFVLSGLFCLILLHQFLLKAVQRISSFLIHSVRKNQRHVLLMEKKYLI